MANIIDLDAARAARAEARGEAPVVKLFGKSYKAAAELPLEAVPAAKSQDFEGFLTCIFDTKVTKEIMSKGLSVEDLQALIKGLFEAYGIALPEASASTN